MSAKGFVKDPAWPELKPGLVWLLLATSYIVTWDWFPTWFRVVGGGLVGVGLLIVGVQLHKKLKLREHLRHRGWCSCGYDLRACPVTETSRHWFDVWHRMTSTKKIVECPECGKKQTLWEHE